MLRLEDLGERGLIRELEARGLTGHIGDDTAVLEGGVVVTLDTLVEEVHFRKEWISWLDLGYKAAAVNLSDLAAAAAKPTALVVSLAVPPQMFADDVFDFYRGLNEPGVLVRGGDTVTSSHTVITVMAIGYSTLVPGRSGARPGDIVVVTGPLGASAAGLRALERGINAEQFIAAHRRPPIRLHEGQQLGCIATAMADLSDGLAVEAGHIASESGCCIKISVENVPIAQGIELIGDDPFWAMGEDYELIATVPESVVSELGFPVIGSCVEGSGVEITYRGNPVKLSGWEHFGHE